MKPPEIAEAGLKLTEVEDKLYSLSTKLIDRFKLRNAQNPNAWNDFRQAVFLCFKEEGISLRKLDNGRPTGLTESMEELEGTLTSIAEKADSGSWVAEQASAMLADCRELGITHLADKHRILNRAFTKQVTGR